MGIFPNSGRESNSKNTGRERSCWLRNRTRGHCTTGHFTVRVSPGSLESPPSGPGKTSRCCELIIRGPQMGGQICRGRIWRFWGTPIFSPEVPKYLFLKGLGTSGRKIGAPQKTPNSTTTDLTPHLRPSVIMYFYLTRSFCLTRLKAKKSNLERFPANTFWPHNDLKVRTSRTWAAPRAIHLKANHPHSFSHFRRFRRPHFPNFPRFRAALLDPYFLWGRRDTSAFFRKA